MNRLYAMAAVLALIGCAADPTPYSGASGIARGTAVRDANSLQAEAIPVSTEGTTRPYRVLEDLTGTARQITIFGHVPTKVDLDNELRTRAAELGADAIINVRYGKPGAGVVSWNQISGTGQAIKFTGR